MHILWQRHHVAPCVGMGLAGPGDAWCNGCVRFTAISDQVMIEDENEAHRKQREQARSHSVSRGRRR